MANESITDDSNSGGIDDIDVTMTDDTTQNTSDDSADAQQTDDTSMGGDDNLTSTDDSADTKSTDDKTPAFDADLDDWAEKTGRDRPENDRERKLLQDLRNGQREFTSKRQAKKTADDLQRTIKEAAPKNITDDESVDPLEKDVNALRADLRAERTSRLQSEYFSENGVTAEEVTVMGEILKEKADKGGQKAIEFWTDPDNLSDWHDLAKIRLAKDDNDTSEVVEKAKKEERERLAKISKSGGPVRSAKSTTPAKKEDELVALWKADD